MLRFLFKAILFVIGVLILSNALGTMADRIAPLNIWRVGTQQAFAHLMQHSSSIQAISIGNSHSGAIDFSVLGVEGDILSGTGADLFEINRYAAALSDDLPALRTAFIAISYFSFSRDNRQFDDTRILRVETYAMLPGWVPVEDDVQYLLLGKLHKYSRIMDVARPDGWHEVITDMLVPVTAADSSSNQAVRASTPWGECVYFPASQLEAIAHDIAGKHVARHQAMVKAHPGLEEDAALALAKAIEFFQDEGVRVVLFTPPYYTVYDRTFEALDPTMITHMRNQVRKLQEKYNVDYFDFSRDPELTTRAELFENSDHLNDCGRKAFSERLLKAMNERQY
jgi:hypothetical protein